MISDQINRWITEQLQYGGILALLEEYVGNIVIGIITQNGTLMVALKESTEEKERINTVGMKLSNAPQDEEPYADEDARDAAERRKLPHFVFPLGSYEGEVALFVKASKYPGKQFFLKGWFLFE